ncbi:serine hydrolase domain-containing protein [Leptospira sp. GIMC2001]|uniref:serine hydrolase domain-containing protein n=1 Tax=Leptospira sp. GIMC2001 TaxID=1513297 RepID=UPI0004A5C438|nr:serine hydrolase domain-containing protein [Leptospira sp. GIMC2001]AID56162.1 beta-lactamase [Leptospira sp. GIMC2001]WCL49928.1 serine hydrolase [Leptospira sp. GIMC2001]
MNKIIILMISSILFAVNCHNDQDDDSASLLVLAGIGAGQCSTIDNCFDRFSRTADEGASLIITDRNNRTIKEREFGTIANDRHQIIFSGSKWVTAVTIMRVIDQNKCNSLNLESTTANVLGWTGTRGTITMRQLLAFTSGLNDRGGASGQDSCIANLPENATSAQKDSCVNSIRDNTKNDTPGALFVYNSNHMAVAQRMVEVACNQTWKQIFQTEVSLPLNWSLTETKWVSGLGGTLGGDGSLAGAYGLIVSPREYSRLMLALLRSGNAYNGTSDVNGFLSANAVSEILSDQYRGATIGYSQFSAFGYSWTYGLGNWRYCSNPGNPTECDKDLISHSVGANGFFPWLDRNRGYFGIVSVNNQGVKNSLTNLPPTGSSLFFAETIRPMIHNELNQ